MKAIVTRHVPCTDTKPARIRATAHGVKPLTISDPIEATDHETPHRMACAALVKRQGWNEADSWIMAGLPNGDTVHVSDMGLAAALRALLRTFEDGSHYRTQNPYTRPEVRAGLVALCHLTGHPLADWMNANKGTES